MKYQVSMLLFQKMFGVSSSSLYSFLYPALVLYSNVTFHKFLFLYSSLTLSSAVFVSFM